jgi:hypothetical protein
MRRWLAPPFAALASLPLLVLGTPAAPAAQDTSKATATITLRYTTPPSGTDAPTVVLESLGPAPAAATTLVDEEGRTTVQAVVQDLSAPTCRAAPVRDTGLGDDRWCLLLREIHAGSEVTGKLSGAKSVVTLKVAARPGLLLPTVVAVLVLLVAAGFVLYTSNLMGERANRLLLRAQLRRRSDVDKLPEWVEEAKDYLTYARMRSLVGWMRERGKQRATRARASLAAAEKDIGTDIPPGCPLRNDARTEAESVTVVATDLVSFKGEVIDHPARLLEDQLRQAEALVKDFNRKVSDLLPKVPSAQKPLAEAAVQDARDSLATLSALDVESALPERLNKVIAQLQTYSSQAGAMGMQAIGVGNAQDAGLTATIVRERLEAAADIVAASWPVLLAIVVLMVVATVAALSVSYAPKRAFGTAWDYAALAVGVFGSTSVAGIVAAALLWRRTQPQS